jgi:hypothetical protein
MFICMKCEWRGKSPNTTFFHTRDYKEIANHFCPLCGEVAVPYALPGKMLYNVSYPVGSNILRWT